MRATSNVPPETKDQIVPCKRFSTAFFPELNASLFSTQVYILETGYDELRTYENREANVFAIPGNLLLQFVNDLFAALKSFNGDSQTHSVLIFDDIERTETDSLAKFRA